MSERWPRRRGRVLLVAVVAATCAGLATAAPAAAGAPPTGGGLGPNVIVFTPDMPQGQIQSTLTSIAAQQVPNQFGTQRYAILFAPGTYGSAADPLDIEVGYYTSVAGLGQNPNQVVINGTVNVYNQCFAADNCVALDNFWRSVSNLTIDVAGQTGCKSGVDMWAVSQAAPMRRVQINGGVTLMDYCDGSPDYASGGFIADSKFTGGTVVNGSQQQWLTRDSSLDGWSNSVWNQVFCGDPGAPAQSFATDSGHAGGPSSYTTLPTCPVTREAPYLYLDGADHYRVFVPATQHHSSGPTWENGNTPGRSLPLSSFYVVNAASTVGRINAALKAGDNLLFTPGVYHVPSTIKVTRRDTQIIGLGFPTLVPTNGNVTMSVADVPGVNVSGMIFDAGPRTSPVLLKLGNRGSVIPGAATDPVTVDDVFFRVGGATAGSATISLEDDIDNSILDDIWAWRADHGAGAGTWDGDRGDTGVYVYADDVTAYGLFVEHYQKTETVWDGQRGFVLFFQNENPYEVPSQDVWRANRHQNGYPAFLLPDDVRSFSGYGMGSYSYFDQGVDIENSMAFQAPKRPAVRFHDLLTVFLNGSGGFQSVINGVGGPANATTANPTNLVSYP
ncbi:MAG TPA: hypothetical protein VHF06_01845 [Pseudonocardiaceae bacterium]|jgi:hypothetical protein|nr:hypothetical protein [Pseudonocardiaceae bacterium]